MASRYSDELANLGNSTQTNQGGERSTTTDIGGSSQRSVTNSSSRTSGSQSTHTTQQNMDDSSLAALQTLIKQLMGGGTNQQKAEDAKREQVRQLTQGLLGQFTTDKAFSDAKDLIALSLQQANEKNAPAIAKAIEGAGTSASSMQALIAQNTARDAALAAGALGAEQAKAYGTNTVNLTSVLEALTRPQNNVVNNLVSALGIAKGAVVESQQDSSSSSSTSGTQVTNTENSGRTDVQTSSPYTDTIIKSQGVESLTGSDADRSWEPSTMWRN